MQYNKMKIAVGIFVLSLILTLTFFSYLILEEKGTFDKRYSFYFTTKSATSFSVGMPLKFSGFEIGTIDGIELNDDGSVTIAFSVNEKNHKWISEYCMLLLQKPLIGSPVIEVYSTVGNAPLKEGSFVEIIISDDINGMIAKLEPVVDKLINIIASIDKITSKLSADDSDLFVTIHNIEQFTNKLVTDQSLLTTITGDKKATQSLVDSLHTTSQIMQETHAISKDIHTITSNLHEEIIAPSSDAILEINTILKDVNEKLKALDGTVKSIGSYDQDLLLLKEQISVGLAKSNEIMDKVDAILQDNSDAEVTLP
jgi:ABC-type transporter Mla subunit MlaD